MSGEIVTQRILFGIVIGGMLGCALGVLASVAFAYLHQFHPGLAKYQRDLWSLGAIFLAIMVAPISGSIGVLLGALLMYFRTRRAQKRDA
ncbi:MAG: hypothetical protein B6D41_15085 [Chloroflexi bacterium UTCFX4]|nr:MAG: hypothetical protein B6D41_15085 [Chloroflexi bacterium UTCFX4]